MWNYFKQALNAESPVSFGRLMSVGTILTGIWSVVYVVVKTHALPDAASLAALGIWSVSPYAVNKAAAIFAKPDPPESDANPKP